MVSKALFAMSLAICFEQSLAGGFLASPKVKVEDLEAHLLTELSGGTTGNSTARLQRLTRLEGAIRPFYDALPKEKDGTLNHNVVRYALQRFFGHQHGWFIRGLDLGNATLSVPQANSSSETLAPFYLQTFLEQIMGNRRIGLRELAAFAATLEDLIKEEEKGHLLQAYAAMDQNSTEILKPPAAFDVLQTYMMIYMLRGNWTQLMAKKVHLLNNLFRKKVSHWDDTLLWLKRMVQFAEDEGASHPPAELNFDGAMDVAAEIGDRFARFNGAECGRLKSDLLSKESLKPGRVRLVDFYKMGLQGAWDFNEKIEFLRDTGSLDESDPTTPLVILPNYVQGRSNCLDTSSYYAVCCPNECEPLMQHLERSILSPTARPARISKLVSKLPSATVNAPRTLPKSLMQRLQSIASQHGGEVPLHGRLFAQWMHHAFPRECPFPHIAGTTSAQTADEWMLKTGQAESSLNKDEILAELASDSCRLLPKGVECDHGAKRVASATQGEEDAELPWDSSEELLVLHEPSPMQKMAGGLAWMKPMDPLRDLVFWCALCSMMYGISWAFRSTNAGKRFLLLAGIPLPSATKPDKCFA